MDNARSPCRGCLRRRGRATSAAMPSLFERSSRSAQHREALANDLPIGSGDIEGAHRNIAQQRLYPARARWRVEHAEFMLALRMTRRNGAWQTYWASLGRTATPPRNSEPPHHITKTRSVIASFWIAPLENSVLSPLPRFVIATKRAVLSDRIAAHTRWRWRRVRRC